MITDGQVEAVRGYVEALGGPKTVADKLNVSAGLVSHWLVGRQAVGARIALQFARYLPDEPRLLHRLRPDLFPADFESQYV